jgi:hypothetical protein
MDPAKTLCHEISMSPTSLPAEIHRYTKSAGNPRRTISMSSDGGHAEMVTQK